MALDRLERTDGPVELLADLRVLHRQRGAGPGESGSLGGAERATQPHCSPPRLVEHTPVGPVDLDRHEGACRVEAVEELDPHVFPVDDGHVLGYGEQ